MDPVRQRPRAPEDGQELPAYSTPPLVAAPEADLRYSTPPLPTRPVPELPAYSTPPLIAAPMAEPPRYSTPPPGSIPILPEPPNPAGQWLRPFNPIFIDRIVSPFRPLP